MLPTSLQSHLPVPQDFIKLFWFSFAVAAVAFPSTFPPPKTSGKAAITLFQGLLFITALLPFIFCSLCASLRAPPVSSLIFTVCWGEKRFSIYWHIYLMCFAAHRVIKHCLSHSNNVNFIWLFFFPLPSPYVFRYSLAAQNNLQLHRCIAQWSLSIFLGSLNHLPFPTSNK